jgi:hypothetical protein
MFVILNAAATDKQGNDYFGCNRFYAMAIAYAGGPFRGAFNPVVE